MNSNARYLLQLRLKPILKGDKKMTSNQQLSQNEQIIASDNHYLIYNFLRDRSLDFDEYYDIVIFGFLRAVKYVDSQNLSMENLQKIAYEEMDRELYYSRQSSCHEVLIGLGIFTDSQPDDELFDALLSTIIDNPSSKQEQIILLLAQSEEKPHILSDYLKTFKQCKAFA